MKVSPSIRNLVNKFLNVSVVKSAIDITKIDKLLAEDTNLRNIRFDNLCDLSVQCYNFKKFWSLATTKQLRKDHKCDIKVEDAINVIFGYNKAYFYRLATMGEIVVMEPNLVPKFKKQNQETSGEYVMDALTFIAFAKEGKLKVKQKPQQQKQQDPQNDESDVTDTQNSSSVTEQKDEIVFHLLCDGKEFIVTKHSKGGYISQTKGIPKDELKAFITKYATKDMQDLLRTYNKNLAFGVNLDAVNYTIPIFRAGQRIRPIAYTQTASYDGNGNVIEFGYTGSINFIQGDTPNDPGGSANDYRLLAFANDGLNLFTSQSIGTSGNVTGNIKWNPPIQLGASASFVTSSGFVNPSTGSIYNPTGSLAQLSGSGYILDVKASIDIDFDLTSNSRSDDNIQIYFKIIKNNEIKRQEVWGKSFKSRGENQKGPNNVTLSYTDNAATTSSLYRVEYSIYGWTTDDAIDGAINFAPTSYFQVTQYPAPNTGPVTRFWMTGSNSNLLFAKKGDGANIFGLNDVWGQKQQNINNSGFDPIVYDFEPQAGDEIRFQRVEQQTYTITQVSQSVRCSLLFVILLSFKNLVSVSVVSLINASSSLFDSLFKSRLICYLRLYTFFQVSFNFPYVLSIKHITVSCLLTTFYIVHV